MADFQPLYINWQMNSNRQEHNTDKFHSQDLILRRGQPFIFSVTLNQYHDNNVVLVATTGPSPSESARTMAVMPLEDDTNRSGWSAHIVSIQENTLTFSVTPSVHAPIGLYALSLQPAEGSGSTAKLGTFILLFNPWLQDDAVFMGDEEEREEYVIQDTGAIFVGTADQINMLGWNYGQFEEDILNISLMMLDHSLNFLQDPATDVARRNDPKYVSRVMSAMLNGNDDNGVLSGNWTGKYEGGKDPKNWNGSVEILRKWKSSDFKPVLYGQCWVFAGTLCTVQRCLGIPTRVVTNFNSAHDADGNLTVDVYFDTSGKSLKRGKDSMWNFHVWNESWFVRTDLGPKYNGWQVLDATPQETSEGVFQCGPASVAAIREGDVHLKYDMPFVYAEVNADRITYVYDAEQDKERKTAVDTDVIGVLISTKAVGSYYRQDITSNYKYPEGSPEERENYLKARRKLRLKAAGLEKEDKKPSISGEFKVTGKLILGEDINLALVLKNNTKDVKTVMVKMTAWTIIYNGTLVYEVWKDFTRVSLNPNEEVKHPVKIPYAQYEQYVKSDNVIRTTAVCRATDEDEVVVSKNIILDNPTLTLELLSEPWVWRPLDVQMVFTNPLDEPITNCVLTVEGSGLLRGILRVDVPVLGAREQSHVRFEIMPMRSGPSQLLADFSSNKFRSIKTMLNIDVAE